MGYRLHLLLTAGAGGYSHLFSFRDRAENTHVSIVSFVKLYNEVGSPPPPAVNNNLGTAGAGGDPNFFAFGGSFAGVVSILASKKRWGMRYTLVVVVLVCCRGSLDGELMALHI